MIIFVLHGFASATPNESSQLLTKLFPNDIVIGLNYTMVDPKISIAKMINRIESLQLRHTDFECVFVGASLGGFLAQYLADYFNVKCIIINPAIIPWEDLSRFLGINVNYKTGEKFELTEENIQELKHFYVTPGRVHTLVLLDDGDELLDPEVTKQVFTGHALIESFSGGSHRFEHLEGAAPIMETFMNTITV